MKIKNVLASAAALPVMFVSTVSAQSSGLIDIGSIDTVGDTTLGAFVTRLLNWAVGTAAVVCVAILIASGYMYITASGDEGKVEKATKTLTFAIIGLGVCLIAVLLVNFVLSDILNAN